MARIFFGLTQSQVHGQLIEEELMNIFYVLSIMYGSVTVVLACYAYSDEVESLLRRALDFIFGD